MRIDCTQPITVRVESNMRFVRVFPLRAGETVRVRGEYETDPSGGVIHWAHRDPRGRHPDGFIDINGTRYQ